MNNHAHSFNQETNQEAIRNMADGVQHRAVCNCCGRPIPAYPSPEAAECMEITQKWGYFSGKDGETHHFYICETCYDAWIATFAIAPEVTEDTELV